MFNLISPPTKQYFDGTTVMISPPTGISGSGIYYSPPNSLVPPTSGNTSVTEVSPPSISHSLSTPTSTGTTTPGGGTILSLSMADYIIIVAVIIVVIVIILKKRK